MSAVAQAAARFQITLPTIDLQYSAAGRINDAAALADLGGGYSRVHVTAAGVVLSADTTVNDCWRIRVDDGYRDNDLVVTVVSAHELAHFVLRRDGLPWEDEQLVEVAVVLLGYGPLMLQLRSHPQKYRSPRGHMLWTACGPGYLHPEAIQHVMARRQELQAS